MWLFWKDGHVYGMPIGFEVHLYHSKRTIRSNALLVVRLRNIDQYLSGTKHNLRKSPILPLKMCNVSLLTLRWLNLESTIRKRTSEYAIRRLTFHSDNIWTRIFPSNLILTLFPTFLLYHTRSLLLGMVKFTRNGQYTAPWGICLAHRAVFQHSLLLSFPIFLKVCIT